HELGFSVSPVRRFTEKPKLELAQQYLASGNYQWNAGMFFWRVSTFLDNLKKFLPQTHGALERLAETIGKKAHERRLRAIYPKLQNISVDYAILEPATRDGAERRVFVIPAEVGWSDIGSWAAVHELLAKAGVASGLAVTADPSTGNIFLGPGTAIDAHGNLVSSPGKFTGLIRVNDLVIVDTPDALLVVPRDRAQDVAKLVKHLEERKLTKLL